MPSIDKHWLTGKAFARSLQRAIDRNTMIDMLGIVEYDAQRMAHLEDAGFQDTMPAVECLFDYVLDGVVSENGKYSTLSHSPAFHGLWPSSGLALSRSLHQAAIWTSAIMQSPERPSDVQSHQRRWRHSHGRSSRTSRWP